MATDTRDLVSLGIPSAPLLVAGSTSPPSTNPPSPQLQPSSPADLGPDHETALVSMDGGCPSTPPPPSAPSWPKDALPLELFGQIAGHLSYSDCRQMRLVSKEFNSHMTELILQNAALSYRPDLVTAGTESNKHVQKLGYHFRRFVVASEVSGFDLLCAPVVSSQSIVKSWWGVYRWPATKPPPSMYSALEKSCKNPSGLATVFGYLTKTSSLGICLDSGLGYLCGSMKRPSNHPQVFPQGANTSPRSGLADEPNTIVDMAKHGGNYYALRQMFADSGFESDTEIKEGMRLLGLHEGKDSPGLALGISTPDAALVDQMGANSPLPSQSLNMTHLEKSQLWMLLQSHLAHRGLLSCLSEAMMLAPGFSTSLLSLRISKLSSSLVPELSSHTFWETLSSLHTLFLGVVPDWRQIDSIGEDGAFLQVDRTVAPVSALGPVFDLLNDYVAPRASITTVHFEWVCGGEFANEGSQRNRYILPAPLAKSVDDLLLPWDQVQSENLLILPHVRTLSLKNTWVTPQALFRSVLSMNRSQLRRLDLESFSLSGQTLPLPSQSGVTSLVSHVKRIIDMQTPAVPFTIQSDKAPPCGLPPDGAPKSVQDRVNTILGIVGHATNNQTTTRVPLPMPVVQSNPSIGTWSHFIDFFTPGKTISDVQNATGVQHPPRSRTHAQLLDITFKSCGYVFVGDQRVNNSTVLPQLAYHNLPSLLLMNRPANEINGEAAASSIFQVPEEEDVLGEIIRYLDPDEAITLERVFGLAQTWHGVYPAEVVAKAYHNSGIPWPEVGGGRFSGTISADPEKRMTFVQVVDYNV